MNEVYFCLSESKGAEYYNNNPLLAIYSANRDKRNNKIIQRGKNNYTQLFYTSIKHNFITNCDAVYHILADFGR